MKDSLRSARARAAICAAALALALGGCKAKSTNPDDYVVDTAPFSEATTPWVYVPKVKNLLTGLPATDAEVQAVVADPTALRGLIDGWMALPEFKGRMLDFFRNAFQQSNVTMDAITSSLAARDTYLEGGQEDRLEWSIMDSFPLTAWQLVQEGRPFTETVTTRRYMMTTAMMSLLGYLDMFDVDDGGRTVDRLNEVTSQQLVFDPFAVETTYEESLAAYGPGKSGPWVWHIPVRNLTPECEAFLRAGRATDPTYGMNIPSRWETSAELFGYLFGNTGFDPSNQTTTCDERYDWATQTAYNAPIPIIRDDLTVDDYDDWRMITVEQIPISEADTLPTPLFWDLPALRAATTLRLKSPHVGFLGTLAWLANWPTNESNQARVTANQSLIVALGQSIIPAAAVAPAPVSASDRAHSTDPACAACHVVLDPLRQFFRQSYTFSYHEQRDLGQYLGDAAFLLGGMNVTGRGVGDLAGILATHPHFAAGWAQKLQFWANSNPASEDDPELQRIARVFAANHFDFRVLVREVFSSPLVTLARGTATYRSPAGVTVGIARRDQLCARLSSRLGVPDVCDQRDGPGWGLRGRAQMIATDTYYRAAELPALPREPDLFFRASVEAMCERVAANVVDTGAPPRYTSTSPANVNAAIADMVATIMGIPPSDPSRFAAAVAVLTKHYADADAVASARDSLRSTFVLACSSPSAVLNGI